MITFHPARVFFLVARAANRAVVFRRGPTAWTQMIVWDLDTDKLEYGQWTKAKFQKWRCDLSPSGIFLIYLDDQFEDGDSTTILSKPPYWNAITKWEHYQPIGMGGGLFHSDTSVELNWHFMLETDKLFPVPTQLDVSCKSEIPFDTVSFDIETARLKRDGWSLLEHQEFVDNELYAHSKSEDSSMFWDDISMESERPIIPKLWSKPITNNSFLFRLSYYHPQKHKRLNKFFVKKKQKIVEIKEIDWADLDHKGRILATRKGVLMASKVFKDGSIQLGNLEALHDLNSQTPREIPVPDEMKIW